MKQNQKPCKKTKKVIDRGKRRKALSEVKPVENKSKNLQSFLEISAIHMSTRILSDQRKITSHGENARIS